MKRPLSTILTVLSLASCAAVAVLWLRSYSALDTLHHGWVSAAPSSAAELQVFANRGMFYWMRYDVTVSGNLPPDFRVERDLGVEIPPRQSWTREQTERSNVALDRCLLAFRFDDVTRAGPSGVGSGATITQRWRTVAAPLWAPMVVAGAPPALRLLRRRRARRRKAAGLCESCGYDLRASAVRCPECGTETARGA